MKRSVSCLVAAVAALAAGACQTGDSDHLTWESARLAIPGGTPECGLGLLDADCLERGVIGADGPVPAVLFLHGCAGINGRQFNVFNLFTQAGYVTVMPDSFARPGRTRACGRSGNVVHLRYAEIRYALAQIRKIPWIDQTRLVLAGFSSGGVAADRFGGDEFRARVVLGWGCRHEVAAGGRVPVLNIVGAHDAETRHGNTLCGVGPGPHSRSEHVDAGHDVSQDPEAGRLVQAFLAKTL